LATISPALREYIASIGGVCGADKDLIIRFYVEKKDVAIDRILKRCILKKTVSGFLFELEFEGVTFRLFSSGRAVFRGIKNREELDTVLKKLLI
jgi:hypothetical protein